MEVLILGGTRLMGIHMTEEFLRRGHQVTIATRGITKDSFGDRVKRLFIERTDPQDLRKLMNIEYDLVCDSLAYCSMDVKALFNAVSCSHYTMISSVSVYPVVKLNLAEEDFDPCTYLLKWCHRADYPYDEIKRQAECALFQSYKDRKAAAVRFPYVIGRDDYTKRLFFYVEHIVKGIPMQIDNYREQLSFIASEEAGRFLAWLSVIGYHGSINGAGRGTITLEEILHYVERKTDMKAILTPEGEPAPYNGAPSFSLDTGRAESLGYRFRPIEDYIYELLDYYIDIII